MANALAIVTTEFASVLLRIARVVCNPACLAASCNACRNSSRFSWIDAITGPVPSPNPTRVASDNYMSPQFFKNAAMAASP